MKIAGWSSNDAVRIFFPFVLIYCGAYILNVQPTDAALVVRIAYLVLLPFLIASLVAKSRRDPGGSLFWLALLVLLLLPGIYLEYPSDAWEHFRRVFAWGGAENMRAYHPAQKSAYFFAWSLFGWVDIGQRREAMLLYSALTQFVVLVEVYLLSRALGFSSLWSRVQVIAFFSLFGTSIFSLRYYSLSSTPLALAASFSVLRMFLHWRVSKKLTLTALILLGMNLLLIFLNHLQALLFIVVTASALAVEGFFVSGKPQKRRLRYGITAALILFGFFAGSALMRFFPALYGPDGTIFSSFAGSSAFWRRESRILSTLGLHGVVALTIAITMLRRMPTVALLTVAPIVWLVFPPLYLLLVVSAGEAGTMYRVLFAFPASMMLVAGLDELFRQKLSAAHEQGRALICAGVVAALGTLGNAPNFGRLPFQFHVPTSERSLVSLDATAEWFAQNREFKDQCYIWTDGMTSFFLSSQLSRDLWSARFKPLRLKPAGTAALDEYGRAEGARPVCGILIANVTSVPSPGESWVGTKSGHWPAEYGDLAWYVGDPEIVKQAARLPELGWKATPVPPFYIYYELYK